MRPISVKLGVDKDTIRKRIEKLEKNGVLLGWQLAYNPNLLDGVLFMIHLEVSPETSKDDALKKLTLIPGVIGYVNLFGRELMLPVMCDSEQAFKRSLDLISELTKVRVQWTNRMNVPAFNSTLSLTDWKIIRAVRKNVLISYKDLGRTVGLSNRAAGRRLERLIGERVAILVPMINFRAMTGAIPTDLFVFYANGAKKKEVDARIISRYRDYILRAGWGSPTHGHFTLIVPSLSRVQEIQEWVSRMNEVKEVKINFVLDQVFLFGPYDELVERKLRTSH